MDGCIPKVFERLERACSSIASTAEKPRALSRPDTSNYSSLPPDGLRQRLLTYCAPKWKIKPREISVRALAAHGWQCIENDTLQCTLCRRYINTSLPLFGMSDHSVFRAAIGKINKQIISGHASTCAMRNSSAEFVESFGQEFYLAKITKRYESMKSLTLNNVKMKAVDDGIQFQISTLRLEDNKAAVLACCGWHKSDGMDDVVECDYCERNVGLWMFRNSRELDAECEHQKWCGYMEEFYDGSVTWERQLSVAAVSSKRKRKAPMSSDLAQKVRLLDDAISPTLLQKSQLENMIN